MVKIGFSVPLLLATLVVCNLAAQPQTVEPQAAESRKVKTHVTVTGLPVNSSTIHRPNSLTSKQDGGATKHTSKSAPVMVTPVVIGATSSVPALSPSPSPAPTSSPLPSPAPSVQVTTTAATGVSVQPTAMLTAVSPSTALFTPHGGMPGATGYLLTLNTQGAGTGSHGGPTQLLMQYIPAQQAQTQGNASPYQYIQLIPRPMVVPLAPYFTQPQQQQQQQQHHHSAYAPLSPQQSVYGQSPQQSSYGQQQQQQQSPPQQPPQLQHFSQQLPHQSQQFQPMLSPQQQQHHPNVYQHHHSTVGQTSINHHNQPQQVQHSQPISASTYSTLPAHASFTAYNPHSSVVASASSYSPQSLSYFPSQQPRMQYGIGHSQEISLNTNEYMPGPSVPNENNDNNNNIHNINNINNNGFRAMART